MINFRPLNQTTITQLEEHFSDYIDSSNIIFFNIGNIKNHKPLNLMEVNLEKICFAVGPGKVHIDDNNLLMEEYIKSDLHNPKPVDFCYKINYKDESRILGFIENKILPSTTENSVFQKINEASKQVFENYLQPLKKAANKKYFPDLSPKNFSISICLFYPEKYLSNPYFYYNYCNDKDSNAIERIHKYGFVMLTVFIHTDAINSVEGLELEFKKFFNQSHNFNGSLIIPELNSYTGFIQKDVYDSVYNMSMTITAPQLKNLPYFNSNPSSRISNPRNLSSNINKQYSPLLKEIFFSLVSNYKQYESFKNTTTYDLSEAHRSLGANPRSISFYIPQTIVHISHYNLDSTIQLEERMNQQISFLTCNMSMIDGQHSSKAIDIIIENINKSKILDLELQSIIDNVYGNDSSQFTYESFKKFVNNHHINLSFKGFSIEQKAQQHATNLNNIGKQTDNEKVINDNREKILKISNIYNHKTDSKYKIDVNKGSWVNANIKGINIVSMEKLVNVYGVWNQKEDFSLMIKT